MKKLVNGELVDLSDEDVAQHAIDMARPPKIEDYQNAIQALVDDTARDKQFNDGVTMASYVASTNDAWAAQAQVFVAWRDNVWQYAYSELSKFQSGGRPPPTVDAFLIELPKIAWP